MGTAIAVRGVNKTFRVPMHRPATLKERVLHPLRSNPKTDFQASREISFEVADGEFFGIVGRNGSGKSTLLKMLAGIYRPDSGTIEVEGRISPFIELGVGFNTELPAKDNVVINGTLLGLPRAEILRRYDEIIEFAGLEEFTELKLKNYSSGMLVRLAFSTAIRVDAEIILLDEVMAVGDAGFQEKCFEAFRQMKRDGRTIVLVTHAMDTVRRFCDRAMLLEQGEIVQIGDPDEVAEAYRDTAIAEQEAATPDPETTETNRHGDRAAEITGIRVENAGGEATVVRKHEPITVSFEVVFHREMTSPVFGLMIMSESGALTFSTNTLWRGMETRQFAAGERVTVSVPIENYLGVGGFTLSPGVAWQDGVHMADMRHDYGSFAVSGEPWTGAVADMPHDLTIEKAGA
jgi:ABC-type polysaccharide/polyol phosphate transport system ATPase subunit